MITQLELQKLEALRAQLKVVKNAFEDLDDAIQCRIQDGEGVNPGNLSARIAETVRVNPGWKEIALAMGANEDAVRAATTPSVSYKLIVEMSEAKALRITA